MGYVKVEEERWGKFERKKKKKRLKEEVRAENEIRNLLLFLY